MHAATVLEVAAFSSTLRGLALVPSKWRCLVPAASTPEGA